MIHDIQHRWKQLDKKKIVTISKEFFISQQAANKYINMPEEEINSLNAPKNYKKRKTVMDDYLIIIYKMLYDKIDPTLVFSYIIKSGYKGNLNSLEKYITLLAKNNFGNSLYRS